MKRLPQCLNDPRKMSRPARGAWIETASLTVILTSLKVAPRTGRVD